MPAKPAPIALAVALGSGLGGVVRIISGQMVQSGTNTTMPLGVLAVNLLGCLAIGVLARFTAAGSRGAASPVWRNFWLAGFCGGFTTFSLFSLETLWLMQHHGIAPTLIYSLLTLVGSMLTVMLGWALGERLGGRRDGAGPTAAATPETPPDQESD